MHMIRALLRQICRKRVTLESLRGEIMAKFQEVKADVEAARAEAEVAAANAAEVNVKVTELIRRFDEILVGGIGATQLELDELRASLVAVRSAISSGAASDQATEDAVDPKIV